MVGCAMVVGYFTQILTTALLLIHGNGTEAMQLILYFISIPILLKGLSTGTSFFGMSDVNNIFTAPISDKKILVYGVGRQLVDGQVWKIVVWL